MMRLLVLAVLVCGALSSPGKQGSVEPQSSPVFGCYHTNWSQYRPGAGHFVPEDIDPFLCTHLFYAFAKIEDGVLVPIEWNDESTEGTKGMYERFTDLKITNPRLKTLLAVGGWSHKSDGFTEVVASASSRQKFNDHAITYLRKWNFDGLDLDWEYPGDNMRNDDPSKKPANKERFTLWVQELRAAFEAESAATGQERLLLTAAVAAGKGNMDAAYEIDQIQADLDWINLMSYDLSRETVTSHHTTTRPSPGDDADTQLLTVELRAAFEAESAATGQERLLLTAAVAAGKGNMDAAYEIDQIQADLDWINLMSYDLSRETVTSHHTTTRPSPGDDADTQLLTVEWAANEWLARGTPASKLVLGMASYGRTFTLAGAENGVNAPATGGGSAGRYTGETGLWSYYEICEKLAHGFKVEKEPERQITYAHSHSEWVGYDDVDSLEKKGAIIQELGLRGGMVWTLDQDDFGGTFCGQGTWPLIRKMNAMVLGDDYSPNPLPTDYFESSYSY